MKFFSAANILRIAPWLITLLFLPYLFLRAKFGGDFLCYLGAADALANGKNCYNTWFSYQYINVGVQYSYSPFFALILIPTTFFQNQIVLFVFLLTCLIMFWRVWFIISDRLQIHSLIAKEQLFWSALLFFSVIRFLLHNFEMVQVNLMIFYFSVEGLYQISKNRKITGGFLLGAGIAIKLLPLLFVPYLIYRKEAKAAVSAVSFFAITLLLPIPFLGVEFTTQLLINWWHIINPLRPEYTYLQSEYGGVGIQSLSAFVSTYFVKSNYQGFSISIMNLREEQVKIVLYFLQSLFVVFTLYFLSNRPFTSPRNDIHAFYEQAYIFAITPLIFPHQQKYAFIYLMAAYAFVYADVVLRKKKDSNSIRWLYFLLIIAFVLLTLSTDGLTGKYMGAILQYAKVITLGTIILIGILAISDRNLLLASKKANKK